MTCELAIAFLEANQPLPPDEDLSQEQIDTFDQVRRFATENPDPRFIPLMLHSFGEGSCYGVYQVCDRVFRQYESEEVVPHLVSALASPHWGVRYWTVQWACEFPDQSLIAELIKLTRDTHEDCHYPAVAALGEIFRVTGDQLALSAVRDRRCDPIDSELMELIDEITN